MSNLKESTNPGPITDGLESPSGETISKHDSLYFEEGNIVLLSLPKDNVITAFKLYKDFLIVHSLVFRDMFSMPSPQKREEYDNVPYVQAQDEAAYLVHFLNAIYDFETVPSKRDFYFSMDKVEGVFALSKKYQCEKLLNYMRKTLSAVWPKDLAAWDSFFGDPPILTADSAHPENFILKSTLPEPCSAIHLARDYDVPEILPTAFYYLFRKYFSGPHLKPRSEVTLSAFLDPRHSNFPALSNNDRLRFFQGCYALQRFMNHVYIIRSAFMISCDEDTCSTAMLGEVLDDHTKARSCDPLSLLNTGVRELTFNGTCLKTCLLCDGNITDLLLKKRAELWDSLPTFFGLDTKLPDEA